MGKMLNFLDHILYWFHIAVIIINSTGFFFRKTRKLQFILIHVTLFSWIALGYIYGWGYCFLTDWHYDVLIKSGGELPPPSFIVYLAQRCCNIAMDPVNADFLAVAVLVLALFGAYYFKLKSKINM
jgi:hypothetical protein